MGVQAELPETLESVTTSQTQRSEDALRELYFERLREVHESKDMQDAPKLVEMVIERARRVVAHPARPTVVKSEPFAQFPWGELDIEDSLEENWDLSRVEDLRVEVREERAFQCVTMLDCSSSMSGEKHLTASVAVAVLLLKIAARDAGVVVFHTSSQDIKPLASEDSTEKTVWDFLRFRPKGFTNIALGLETGLKQLRRSGAKKRIGLIATDGRSTQGGDPFKVAKQFDCLVVLHLHGPGSYLEASQKMATEGNGICLEVEEFEDLPKKMYDALRLLAHR